MKFVIVTGLSGSGKSEVMRVLEDIGYYCVDNLPPSLIPKFAELCHQPNSSIDKVAFGVDIRGMKFFEDLGDSLNYLTKVNYKYAIIFHSIYNCISIIILSFTTFYNIIIHMVYSTF